MVRRVVQGIKVVAELFPLWALLIDESHAAQHPLDLVGRLLQHVFDAHARLVAGQGHVNALGGKLRCPFPFAQGFTSGFEFRFDQGARFIHFGPERRSFLGRKLTDAAHQAAHTALLAQVLNLNLTERRCAGSRVDDRAGLFNQGSNGVHDGVILNVRAPSSPGTTQ